jgi:hypothetical protein
LAFLRSFLTRKEKHWRRNQKFKKKLEMKFKTNQEMNLLTEEDKGVVLLHQKVEDIEEEEEVTVQNTTEVEEEDQGTVPVLTIMKTEENKKILKIFSEFAARKF